MIIYIYQHFHAVLDAIKPRISILTRVWKAMKPKVFICIWILNAMMHKSLHLLHFKPFEPIQLIV